MAITLKANVRWGGVDYAPGATIPGLTPSDEAGLVSSNRAEWVGTPSTTSNAGVPVMATTGPGGGIGIPVGGTGLMLPAVLRQQPNQPWPVERPAYDGPITLIGWSDPPAWPGGEYDQYINIPRIYAPVVEEFAGEFVGAPEGWSLSWGNTLTLSRVADARAENGFALSVAQGASTNTALFWESAGISENMEVLSRAIAPLVETKNGPNLMLLLRATGELGSTTTTRNGYCLALRSTVPRALRMFKLVNGSVTQIGSDVLLPESFSGSDAIIMMRFSAIGALLSGAVWLETDGEHTALTITETDASHSAGYVGVGSNAENHTVRIDWVAATLDGTPAPRP